MPQTIENTVTITLKEWLDAGLTENQYKKDKQRYFLRTTRACKGQEVQIDWNSILPKRRVVLQAKFGDPTQKVSQDTADVIEADPKAYKFFTEYVLADGRNLPAEAIREYCANASVLNAISEITQDSINMRRAMGGAVRMQDIWEGITRTITSIDRSLWGHTLPENSRRLRDKHKEYMQHGYECLVPKHYGNQRARKVSKQMEDLFIALYTTKNRHFASTVRELYLQFLAGSIQVVDVKSGELFNREDFFDQNGVPLYISESTTWSYLSKPGNRQVINKFRTSGIDFTTQSLPYNHRHKPEFSLSKVSFDDRDLPRRTANGFEVKSYYAYEPFSGCFIGWSYSREKNIALIIDCFRSMLQFCLNESLPWPGEAEVERHLMTQLRDQLETMFAHVRWCNPQNSREKRAEHGIRAKKYGAEKLMQDNIGRWSNKHDAYQINQDENRIYEYEDLIADDIQSIHRRNNELHPNHPGKTRLQVLREMANPNLADPKMHIILKHLGNRTDTSVRNFDFVRVQYKMYRIDSDHVLSLLLPNNYDVQAYWLPNQEGKITEVYLYQGDKYLCKSDQIETYNEAQAERTERDEEIRTDQAKIQAHARKRINDRASEIPKIEVIRNLPDYSDLKPEILEVTPETAPEPDFDINSITADADYWSELGKSAI